MAEYVQPELVPTVAPPLPGHAPHISGGMVRWVRLTASEAIARVLNGTLGDPCPCPDCRTVDADG